jgi:hypothetical protein
MPGLVDSTYLRFGRTSYLHILKILPPYVEDEGIKFHRTFESNEEYHLLGYDAM